MAYELPDLLCVSPLSAETADEGLQLCKACTDNSIDFSVPSQRSDPGGIDLGH
jgi:hypothetical protein